MNRTKTSPLPVSSLLPLNQRCICSQSARFDLSFTSSVCISLNFWRSKSSFFFSSVHVARFTAHSFNFTFAVSRFCFATSSVSSKFRFSRCFANWSLKFLTEVWAVVKLSSTFFCNCWSDFRSASGSFAAANSCSSAKPFIERFSKNCACDCVSFGEASAILRSSSAIELSRAIFVSRICCSLRSDSLAQVSADSRKVRALFRSTSTDFSPKISLRFASRVSSFCKISFCLAAASSNRIFACARFS